MLSQPTTPQKKKTPTPPKTHPTNYPVYVFFGMMSAQHTWSPTHNQPQQAKYSSCKSNRGLRGVQVTLEESDGDEPMMGPSDEADEEYDRDESTSAAAKVQRRRLFRSQTDHHHRQDEPSDDGDDDDDDDDDFIDDVAEDECDVAPDEGDASLSVGSDSHNQQPPSPHHAAEMWRRFTGICRNLGAKAQKHMRLIK